MSFNLSNIIKVLDAFLDQEPHRLLECRDRSYNYITNNSREVRDNSVFVAIAGSISDGHKYISNAIDNGATLIIHNQEVEQVSDVLYIKVNDSYSAYAHLAELYYNFPASKMKLIGITGTNGKTTTAFLIKSIIEQANKKCAFISTVEYGFPGVYKSSTRTTPDAMEFQKFLSDAIKANCEYLVMEVSSHALVQNRTASAKFAITIFTNLSGDHLDYHKNMTSYFYAKYKLFDQYMESQDSPYLLNNQDGEKTSTKKLCIKPTAVINYDDPYGKKIVDKLSEKRSSILNKGNLESANINNINCIKFGKGEGGDLIISNISTSLNGTEIVIDDGERREVFSSNLYGEFNAYNIASAVAAARALNFDYQTISKGIIAMKSVPGRMQGIKLKSGALAIIDYAHTDDALKNVLKTIKMMDNIGRLILVFGCGGDRDKSKRPRMATIAAKFADEIFITSDNPRSEDPQQIIDDIKAGLPSNIQSTTIIDRKKAIIQAISIAKNSDVLLIAGKGHENYQEIKGIKIPFDDFDIVNDVEM